MIGGTDLTLNRVFIRKVLIEEFLKTWPDLAYEANISLDGPDELFVYRDSEAKAIWDEKGAVPEVEDLMIHVMWSAPGEASTHFVVSKPGSESYRMVAALEAT